MKYIGRKTPFPPVGLLTFAALMPEEWDFELVDLNTESPSDDQLLVVRLADRLFDPIPCFAHGGQEN